VEKQNSDLISLTGYAFVTSVVIGRDASLVLFARVLLAWVDLLVWLSLGNVGIFPAFSFAFVGDQTNLVTAAIKIIARIRVLLSKYCIVEG
jgi:hypothetical protein